MKAYLGIDTSCYTTSAAILDAEGKLLADSRRILAVKPGGRGLSQSEMVFQHTRNFPVIFREAIDSLGEQPEFAAVGVSACPRPLPDSYMPAFLPGRGFGEVLAASHGIPLYRLSHQENHIWAGVWSAGGPAASAFLALHLSGGTTELLAVRREPNRLSIRLLGGTADISAGQFIDRVGVKAGLPFPAGRHLEQMAARADCALPVPTAAKGLTVSFSGPATHCLRLLERGEDPARVAAGVQRAVAKTIAALIRAGIQETNLHDVLFVGGVMSNQAIRSDVAQTIKDMNAFFPSGQFSPDNAAGAAYFAWSASTSVR